MEASHSSATAKQRLKMNEQDLIDIAKTLVADDKGLLAMDESNPTCNKRFARLGIPQTEAARREIWRGEEAHVLAAQEALYHRAKCNRAARRGDCNVEMETAT
jgi:fructose-bisphosphate aldolase class 1